MARRGDLADGLQPEQSLASVAKVVGNMFLLFPSVRMGLEQTKAVTAAYVTHLKGLPLWAIEIGCRSCVSKGLAFPPSAGELRVAAEAALQPVRDEEAAIRKVLEAEIYHSAPKSERQRIIRGFDELKAELAKTNAMEPHGKTGQKYTRPVNGSLTALSDHAMAAFNAKAPKLDAAE